MGEPPYGRIRLPSIIATLGTLSILEGAALLLRDHPAGFINPDVIAALNSSVSRVVVTNVTDGTFHARLYLELADGSETEIDSRTSDAIAVAVRTGSTIYVDERVLDEAGVEPDQVEPGDESDEKLAVFREFINSLDVDLGGGEKGPPSEEQES